jgi:hypothetical protein
VKQVSQSKSVGLPPFELYVEDIVGLFEVMRGVAKDVRIEVAGYELESPDELNALSEKLSTTVLHEFKIVASQPYLTLYCYPYSARFYISDQSLELVGVQTKISEIITSRRQTLWWAMNPWVVPITGPMAIYVGSQFSGWILSATAIITAATYWWIYRRTFHRYTILCLTSRKERVSFWVRNRDKIILVILSALLGAIAKGLYEYIMA